MIKNNKITIVLALIAFMVGLFLGRDWGNFKGEDAKKLSETPGSQNLPHVKASSRTILKKSQDDFASFVKRLDGNLSENEYDKLFEEVFKSQSMQSAFNISSDKKMALLLEKWGECNPRVALKKIIEAGGYRDLAFPLFKGWAKKDPEAAASFFEASQDHPLIKMNSDVLMAIAANWAAFAPEKAWNWLQTQNGKTASGLKFLQCRDSVILLVMAKQPKQFSSFMEKLDKKDLERNAHNMGVAWAEKGEEFENLLKKLTPEGQIKAEAGKIVSLSKGEFEGVKRRIEQFDGEKQGKLAEKLAEFLLDKTCLDMKDRVDWVVEKLPEEKWPDYEMSRWFRDDREGAQAWLESLPAGKKKEKLEQLFAK